MNCEMNKKKNCPLIIIMLVFWLSIHHLNAQDVNSNNSENSKATEILANSRKAIALGTEKINIQKISLIFNVSRITKEFIKVRNENRESQSGGEREYHAALPNKFRYSESITTNETNSITKYILDDNLLDFESYSVWEGQRYEHNFPGSKKPTDEQVINEKKEELFFLFFPILLESADFQLEFRFIGKAELKSGKNSVKADVLEADIGKEKKIKLFFDETTHLLNLLITEGKLPRRVDMEEKRYYTDYKAVEGLMIANKINVNRKESNDIVIREYFEQQILKSAKIGPTFKPDFFRVKKK